MTEKKEKAEKIYYYVLIMKCEKCGTVAETAGPCVKCQNMTFLRTCKAVEKK